MGVVPLLTRRLEIALAKRMNAAVARAEAVSRSPLVAKELIAVVQSLRKGASRSRESYTSRGGTNDEKVEENLRQTLRTIKQHREALPARPKAGTYSWRTLQSQITSTSFECAPRGSDMHRDFAPDSLHRFNDAEKRRLIDVLRSRSNGCHTARTRDCPVGTPRKLAAATTQTVHAMSCVHAGLNERRSRNRARWVWIL